MYFCLRYQENLNGDAGGSDYTREIKKPIPIVVPQKVKKKKGKKQKINL